MNVQELKSGFHVGMHGLGMISGVPHTNAIESFDVWKDKGATFFETDIAVTDDGRYVLLAHNAAEKDLKKLEVFEKPADGVYSLQWLQGIRTCGHSHKGGLSIATLEAFLDRVGADERLVAMIDLYGRSFDDAVNVSEILRDFGEKYSGLLDRVLLELYSLEQIGSVKARYKDLKIIACVREDGYDFWGGRKDPARLEGVDFISCKWKYVPDEEETIAYCRSHDIGVLSLSRFDTHLKEKKRRGVNVNLVDVRGNGNPLVYGKSVFQFALHKAVLLMRG